MIRVFGLHVCLDNSFIADVYPQHNRMRSRTQRHVDIMPRNVALSVRVSKIVTPLIRFRSAKSTQKIWNITLKNVLPMSS